MAPSLAGDPSAFDQLVLRWDRKIQGAIYRLMGSEEEARDLCQEASSRPIAASGASRERLGSRRGSTRSHSTCAATACGAVAAGMVSLDAMEPDAQGQILRDEGASTQDLVEARDLQQR